MAIYGTADAFSPKKTLNAPARSSKSNLLGCLLYNIRREIPFLVY